jgi:hypothetical protein
MLLAMIEVDQCTPACPPLLTAEQIKQAIDSLEPVRYVRTVDPVFDDFEDRWLTSLLNDHLGPGWYRRAAEDEYVGRDGTIISGESVRYMMVR